MGYARHLITQSEVLKDFEYRDGILFRRGVVPGRGKNDGPAGTVNNGGRLVICYRRRMLLAHRLVWFMFHGEWPAEIDHKDRNPLNNRIENLRLATHKQNQGNQKMRVTNKTGYKGVSYHTSRGLYIAQLGANGKHYFLGRFKCPVEAAKAYDTAAEQHLGIFAALNFPKVLDVI